jgi:hypothetical protein
MCRTAERAEREKRAAASYDREASKLGATSRSEEGVWLLKAWTSPCSRSEQGGRLESVLGALGASASVDEDGSECLGT